MEFYKVVLFLYGKEHLFPESIIHKHDYILECICNVKISQNKVILDKKIPQIFDVYSDF